MIRYYQELLNECIDLQEDKQILTTMQKSFLIMNDKLLELKIKKVENSIQLINFYIHNPNWK